MTEFINSLAAVAAGVFGAGWGIQFLYYRSEKRKREAETRRHEAETRIIELNADAKENAYWDEELKQAYERITHLQNIVNREREKWEALAVEMSGLKMKLLKEKEARELAEYNMCTRRGCDKRCPPRIKKEVENENVTD